MDLRHTAATNMVKRAEIHPAVVAETTGHSWQVLMSTYVHETEEGNRKVAERLDDLIRVSESEDQEPVS